MLKVPYKRLRPNSKGGLNNKCNRNNLLHNQHKSKLQIANVGNKVLQGIPVLSIFALVGILGISLITTSNNINISNSNSSPNNSLISNLTDLFFTAEETYAVDEVIGDSTASITISGEASNKQVEGGYGVVSYRSHNVRVQANNINNYTLSISGPSTLVTRTKDGNSVANATTISSAGGVTGATMASSTSKDNTWGYGYSTNTSITNAELTYTAPTTSGTNLSIGNIDSSTHNLDKSFKLAFAIKFGENAVAGRYYNNVVLSLVATPRVLTTYSITYNGNGNTSGTVPTKQEASLYDTSSHSFIASTQGTLAKTGYTFLGWAETSTATTPTYTAGATISLTAVNPSKVLYAVWKQNLTLNSITNMQEMTAEICKNTASGTTVTLTDMRDGGAYTVKKLVDNNCWMIQNLRVTKESMSSYSNASAKNRQGIMTSVDSDVSVDFSMPTSSINGFTAYDTAYVYYGNSNDGAYYSWNAATAGTGKRTMVNTDASSSICPKGWGLPKGGYVVAKNTASSQTGNDFANVFNYGVNNLVHDTDIYSVVGATFTNKTLIYSGTSWSAVGGYYGSGSSALGGYGTHGNYWARTALDNDNAFMLYFLSGSLYPSADSTKTRGFSVRCVAYSS